MGQDKIYNPREKTISGNKGTHIYDRTKDVMNLYKNQRWNQVFRMGEHSLSHM